MPLPDHPLKIKGLEYAELEGLDEVICMEPVNTSSLALNTTALAVLDMCDGNHNVEDISRIICEVTGGESARVQKDVKAILGQFAEYGFISPA